MRRSNMVRIFLSLLFCMVLVLPLMISAQPMGGRGQQHRFGLQRLTAHLDPEQRAELKTLVNEMRAEGAARDEIHDAVTARLEAWGVELPERGLCGPFGQRVIGGLDDDQRLELRTLIEEMRAEGATRKEIHAAVREKIKTFKSDFNLPDHKDVDEEPDASGLNLRNYPNPFNPETNLTYRLEEPEQVSLSIFNAQGQLVRTLVNEYQAAGEYRVRWDGFDQAGERASSGLYFYRLQAGDKMQTDSMLLLR